MKKLLIGLLVLGSLSAYSQGKIINRKTGDNLQVSCTNSDCTTFDIVVSVANSTQVVKEDVTTEKIINKVKFLTGQTEYFEHTKGMFNDETLPFALFFFPVTILNAAGDALYSGGVYLTKGAKDRKLERDVRHMLDQNGDINVSNRRFERVRSLVLSL